MFPLFTVRDDARRIVKRKTNTNELKSGILSKADALAVKAERFIYVL